MLRKIFILLIASIGYLPLALQGNEVHSLQENHPLLNELVFQIRTPETGKEQFRHCLKKIGEYLGIEIAKTLSTKEVTVTTILDLPATHTVLDEKIVIIPVLRAGLPVYMGLQEAFPSATAGFLGAMRDEETLKPYLDYIAFPPMENSCVIIAETMIATGGSILQTIDLVRKYHPKKIIVAGIIAAKEGIVFIQEHAPDVELFVACIDPDLNDHGYILPGLGDAGDRCFGSKLPRGTK